MIGSGNVHSTAARSPRDKLPAQPGYLSRDCKLWNYTEDEADTVAVVFKELKPPVSIWIDLDAGTYNVENEQGDFNGYIHFKETTPKCSQRKPSLGKYHLQQCRREKAIPSDTVSTKEAKRREVQRRMGRRRPSTMEGVRAALLLEELEQGFEIRETDKGCIVKCGSNMYRVSIAPI